MIPENYGKIWSKEAIYILKRYVEMEIKLDIICKTLKRSELGVLYKMFSLGLYYDFGIKAGINLSGLHGVEEIKRFCERTGADEYFVLKNCIQQNRKKKYFKTGGVYSLVQCDYADLEIRVIEEWMQHAGSIAEFDTQDKCWVYNYFTFDPKTPHIKVLGGFEEIEVPKGIIRDEFHRLCLLLEKEKAEKEKAEKEKAEKEKAEKARKVIHDRLTGLVKRHTDLINEIKYMDSVRDYYLKNPEFVVFQDSSFWQKRNELEKEVVVLEPSIDALRILLK